MPDVPTDEVLIESDGGDEVSTCPERLLFVEATHSFDLLLEPGRALPLQYLHDVRDRVFRCCEEYQVDVVDLNVQLDDLPVFPLDDVLEDSFQIGLHLLIREDLSSVLWGPY